MHILRFRRFGAVSFWHVGLVAFAAAVLLGASMAKAQSATPTELVVPSPLAPIATALTQSDAAFCDALSAEALKTATSAASTVPARTTWPLDMRYNGNAENITTVCPWYTTTFLIAVTDTEKVLGAETEASTSAIETATGVSTPAPSPVVEPSVDPTPAPAKPASVQPSATPTIEPTTTPEPIAVPSAAPAISTAAADLESLFAQHAATHGVDPEIMKKIAQCESGMRPEAVNGPYGGMFQFVSSTWVSNRKAMGKDTDPALRFNAEEAIETAAFKMGRDGYGAWPSCSRKALNHIAQAN